MTITHEKTKDILKVFEEITRIPRCSRHEEKILAWLLQWAEANNLTTKQDTVGNIVIRVTRVTRVRK